MMFHSNLILIGMPAVGKSTVGRLIAERLACPFIDTDTDIEAMEGRRLSRIIQEAGVDGFLRIEEAHLLSIQAEGAVISTGGSAVYGKRGMAHLKRLGIVVYLRADMAALARHMDDPDKRGVVKKPGQSLRSLFEEREALYLRYADRVVTRSADEGPETTADSVLSACCSKP